MARGERGAGGAHEARVDRVVHVGRVARVAHAARVALEAEAAPAVGRARKAGASPRPRPCPLRLGTLAPGTFVPQPLAYNNNILYCTPQCKQTSNYVIEDVQRRSYLKEQLLPISFRNRTR